MRIFDIRERTVPISPPIRSVYIEFFKMALILVAVITDAVRNGRPVIGFGFNSNGRYGQQSRDHDVSESAPVLITALVR